MRNYTWPGRQKCATNMVTKRAKKNKREKNENDVVENKNSRVIYSPKPFSSWFESYTLLNTSREEILM